MIYYKLTNQDGYTRRGEKGETKWKPGVWQKPLSGRGTLCGPGWYHFYYSPDLSVLLNPIHADIKNPILWKTECRGKSQDDNGLKIGWTEARVIEQIPLPEWTITQKVAFAILCSLKVEQSKEYVKWAKDWLSGKDRTKETAEATAAEEMAAAEVAAAEVAIAAAAAAAAVAVAWVAVDVAKTAEAWAKAWGTKAGDAWANAAVVAEETAAEAWAKAVVVAEVVVKENKLLDFSKIIKKAKKIV